MGASGEMMIQASHSYSLQSLNLNPRILQSEGMCRGHCGEAKEFNLSQTSWCPLLCLRGRNCMISVSDLNNFREGQNKPSSMQPQGRSLQEDQRQSQCCQHSYRPIYITEQLGLQKKLEKRGKRNNRNTNYSMGVPWRALF